MLLDRCQQPLAASGPNRKSMPDQARGRWHPRWIMFWLCRLGLRAVKGHHPLRGGWEIWCFLQNAMIIFFGGTYRYDYGYDNGGSTTHPNRANYIPFSASQICLHARSPNDPPFSGGFRTNWLSVEVRSPAPQQNRFTGTRQTNLITVGCAR